MSFDPAFAAEPAGLDAQLSLAAHLIRDNQAAKLGGILRRQSVRFPARFPNDPRWRLLSALAWYVTGMDRAFALSEAQVARTIAPGFWPAHLAEAHLLCEIREMDLIHRDFSETWRHGRRSRRRPDEGWFHEALDAAQMALALAPGAEVWNDVGAIHAAGGRFDRAAEAFETALVFDPGQRHAMANYAVALLATGQAERLRDYLHRNRLPVRLPDCLGEAAAEDPVSVLAQPPEPDEWRRTAVFSQHWWRVLPSMIDPAEEVPCA